MKTDAVPREALKAIIEILARGNTARVYQSASGWTVSEEKLIRKCGPPLSRGGGNSR